jgi:predicted AAA+ superfamily ATPase
VDVQLAELLTMAGFVVIEGPKAVGKTETAKQQAASVIHLDVDINSRESARLSPSTVLNVKAPLLIDEWQLVPELWSHVKVAVDNRQLRGQFILTGSAVPQDDITRDSAAGRVARIKMRPMSLFESGESTGVVSIKKLFMQEFEASRGPNITIDQIAELTCRGGWPRNLELSNVQARKSVKSYVEELATVDLQRVTGIKYNKTNVLKVLNSLARNVGTKASDTVIGKDAGSNGVPIDRKIVAGYLDALGRVMVTENNPPWTPNMRSRYRINGSATRYFIDPSIATAAMGASPQTLLRGEIQYLGFLFENLAIRDLRIYMQAVGGSVKQYRDSSGLEVDAILETDENEWAAIEIKLDFSHINQAAENLLKFKERVDVKTSGEPAFLAIITATGHAYQRLDGVYVLPIATLQP